MVGFREIVIKGIEAVSDCSGDEFDCILECSEDLKNEVSCQKRCYPFQSGLRV